ncbi:MAG: hypothetical protein ABIF71_08330 [Planctomycetota bacterium]
MMRRAALVAAFLAAAQLWAAGPVSVAMADRPVAELFEILKKDGGLAVVYSRECLYRDGRPVTINIDLRTARPELVLELALKATGLTQEIIDGVHVVLPARQEAGPAAPQAAAASPAAATPAIVTVTAAPPPPPAASGSVEVVGTPAGSAGVTAPRYAGNFMFGQGTKVYLNLIIPPVNAEEEQRLTRAMTNALADGVLTPVETTWLFGSGTEIGGTELGGFLKPLAADLQAALADGALAGTEINKARNDFINAIVRAYEGI